MRQCIFLDCFVYVRREISMFLHNFLSNGVAQGEVGSPQVATVGGAVPLGGHSCQFHAMRVQRVIGSQT